MTHIDSEEDNPVDNYRERLADADVWDELPALKSIRWHISNDEDLDDADSQHLLTIVNRRIKYIIYRILDDES